MAVLHDKFGRAITDLRISITDRCNYKCVYCRTGNEGALYGDLAFEDYLRMARVLVGMGINKVRLTGGEPLLRKGVVEFVRELAKLRPQGLEPTSSSDANGTAEAMPFRVVPASFQDQTMEQQRRDFSEPLDIALTTNGHMLADLAQPLKDAGLTRVTVSMDAVDPVTFARITRVPNSFEQVLAGVRAARRAGLDPVKVNCVLLRGFNEEQIPGFARFAREEGVVVRFIEFMPLEEGRLWSPATVVPIHEVIERLSQFRPVVALGATHTSETACRYTFDDGVGEIGIIAPVSQAFCGQCSRVRLTSDGKIRTCLFSQSDHDLYGVARRGGTDAELADFIVSTVEKKEARHHIGEPGFLKPSRSMVHIGG